MLFLNAFNVDYPRGGRNVIFPHYCMYFEESKPFLILFFSGFGYSGFVLELFTRIITHRLQQQSLNIYSCVRFYYLPLAVCCMICFCIMPCVCTCKKLFLFSLFLLYCIRMSLRVRFEWIKSFIRHSPPRRLKQTFIFTAIIAYKYMRLSSVQTSNYAMDYAFFKLYAGEKKGNGERAHEHVHPRVTQNTWHFIP